MESGHSGLARPLLCVERGLQGISHEEARNNIEEDKVVCCEYEDNWCGDMDRRGGESCVGRRE